MSRREKHGCPLRRSPARKRSARYLRIIKRLFRPRLAFAVPAPSSPRSSAASEPIRRASWCRKACPLKRETRFAAAGQHTTSRHEPRASANCGTSRRNGSALTPRGCSRLVNTRATAERAVEVMRRADLCRSHGRGCFVCGWSCVDRPPRSGISRAHDTLCGTMRLDASPSPRLRLSSNRQNNLWMVRS